MFKTAWLTCRVKKHRRIGRRRFWQKIGGLSIGIFPHFIEKIAGAARAEEMRDLMIQAGFRNVRFEFLTSGVAAFHFGEK